MHPCVPLRSSPSARPVPATWCVYKPCNGSLSRRGDLRSHKKRCKKLHFLAGITDEPVAAFRGRVPALEMPIANPDFLNDMVRAKRFFCLLIIPG